MMKQFLGALLLLSATVNVEADEFPTATVVEVRKIWDRAPHNAFTDLIRFQDRWYCVFREGQGHISPDGALRVITSEDGNEWKSAALLTSSDSDLRDAKITITPDGQLVLSGAETLHSDDAHKYQSLVWFSPNGTDWSNSTEVADPDFWLWRTTWHKGTAYGFGYGCNERNRSIRLYSSSDGKQFKTLVKNAFDDGYANETSMVFLSDDSCYCLLRRDSDANGNGPNTVQLGRSKPPYTDWNWKDLGVRIGGPHMIVLPSGEFVAAVRMLHRARTSLCWVDPEKGTLTEFQKLPSGGDTSYSGLVWHDDMLWISYYSSHEGKTNIYLAKVRFDS